MTSTLHIFGDSFATNPEAYPQHDKTGLPIQIHPNYAEDLGNRLGCSHINWGSLPGVSNDWIFNEIYENYKNISANDYAVILFTQINRKWFFEAHQGNLSNYTMSYVKNYLKHLQNDRLDTIITLGYIIATISLLRDRCPFVILPAYPIPANDIKGCLDEVSRNEILGSVENWYHITGGFDPRLNHLSIFNHKVLSMKLYNYFKHNTPIDLTTEFHKNILKVNV